MYQKITTNWFLLGMVVAVILAWLFPDAGAKGGWLQPELMNKVGVALIFFITGLTLSFASLKSGIFAWKLHAVIQSSTFILFPIIGFAILWLGKGHLPDDLLLGLFFLCVLPSTVSSSVAMTSAAKGNVPVAVFNATLSNIAGIFITPLFVAFVFTVKGEGIDVAKVILDLVKWFLVPLAIGQMMRPVAANWAARNKRHLSKVDRLTILFLIYTAFCDSMKMDVWSGHGTTTLLIVAAIVIALFFTVMGIMIFTCNRMGLKLADKAAVVFCGSKKSLATGVPMARMIFGAYPGLSLILLPIMIYHSFQLVVCGVLAGKWAKQAKE